MEPKNNNTSVCCCSLPVWRRSSLKKGLLFDLFCPPPPWIDLTKNNNNYKQGRRRRGQRGLVPSLLSKKGGAHYKARTFNKIVKRLKRDILTETVPFNRRFTLFHNNPLKVKRIAQLEYPLPTKKSHWQCTCNGVCTLPNPVSQYLLQFCCDQVQKNVGESYYLDIHLYIEWQGTLIFKI